MTKFAFLILNYKSTHETEQCVDSIENLEQEENDVIVEVALENDPNALAFFIRLSLKDEKDELLYPVFWEDNYLSLIPGEKRTLKCVVPQQVAEVESVTLTVSGWNVPEKKIKLFLDGMK